MTVSFNIYKIFFAILFLLSMFIGSIRTTLGPIRLDLIFSFIIILYFLFIKRIINIKVLRNTLPFTLFIIFFIFWLPFKHSELNLRDILFIIIPIYSIATYYVLFVLCKNIDLTFINKYLKLYLIINFIFIILQYTNLFGSNSILNPYYTMLAYNNGSTEIMVQGLTQRPFGLVGNPTFTTFSLYVVYKLSTIIKKSKFITFVSLIAIVISGGRMVMFFAIIWEIFEFIYKRMTHIRNMKQLIYNILFIIFGLLFFTIIITLIIYYTPFLYEQIWERIANKSYFDSYSYTYRFQMYQLLKSLQIGTILWGGFAYNTFEKWGIEYVDSEYVMRILQFGIFGFFFLFYPLIHFCKRHRYHIYSLFILFACLALAITNFSITNYALIFYIILYMVVIEKTKIFDIQTKRKLLKNGK